MIQLLETRWKGVYSLFILDCWKFWKFLMCMDNIVGFQSEAFLKTNEKKIFHCILIRYERAEKMKNDVFPIENAITAGYLS